MNNDAIYFYPISESTFITLDEKENFEERAAIIEYEAGLSRLEAEKHAFECIVKRRKKFQKVV